MEEGGPQGTTGALSSRAREAELRTFLIADIRSYTSYTTEQGDEAAGALAARFAELTRAAVEANDGDLLELRGDEALAVFVSARRALRAAIDLQARVAEASLPRGVGIGIDAGEAVAVESGFRGTALNLAARLCGQAGPGEIIASETVVSLATRVEGIAYVDPRTYRLKGIDEPIRAVHVVPEGTKAGPEARGTRRPMLLAAGIIGLVLILVGALALSGVFAQNPAATPGPSGPLTGAGASPNAGQSPGSASSGTSAPQPSSGTTPTPSASPVGSSAGSPSPSLSGSPATSPGPIATDQVPLLAYMDPASGSIADEQPPIGGQADAVYADGAFWMVGLEPKSFNQIDPTTHKVVTSIAVPLANDGWWTVSDGLIWLTDNSEPRVIAIDTATGALAHDYELSDDPNDQNGSDGVAVGAGSVWVAINSAGEVVRIDPDTGKVQKRIKIPFPETLAYGNGALWVSGLGQLRRIDPATNEITATAKLAAFHFLPFMTFSSDAVWTADEQDATVWKVDRTGTVQGTYKAEAGARPLQFMDGMVWVGNQDAGSVTAIDADTGATRTYQVGHQVGALAAGDGSVLLGVNRSPEDEIATLEGSVLKVAMTGDALQPPDPAVNFSAYQRMVQFAICAPLLTYPDANAPDGFQLVPEVAAAMPTLSADGRTYTFNVRPGFGFAPPSTEQITPETYRSSIERALSPELGDSRGLVALGDIEGAEAFHAGKADHISGIQVDGDTLAITLTAPSPDFLQRLALPLFCPVPIGTPIVPDGLDPIPPVPTSGPYYLAQHGGGEYAILERNPNYGGTRVPGYDAVALRFGLGDGETVARVDGGQAGMAIGASVLQASADVAAQWGPDSEHAASGDQRWHEIPYPGLDYLMADPHGSLKDPDVRQAISIALDRADIAKSFSEVPADRLLSPAFEVRDEAVPAFSAPDPDGARQLLAGRTVHLRLAVASGCPGCRDFGNEIKSDLAPVGITVEVVEEDDPVGAAADPRKDIDMVEVYVQTFYPDAARFIQEVARQAPKGWLAPETIVQIGQLAQTSGQERLDAAAVVAHGMVLDARVIPVAFPPDGVYFSPDVGCRTIVPGIMNVDLVALCPAEGATQP